MPEKTPVPIEYDLLDKEGNQIGRFRTAQAAASFAQYMWPAQTQDEDRVGHGWDIQIAGRT